MKFSEKNEIFRKRQNFKKKKHEILTKNEILKEKINLEKKKKF